MKRGKYYDIEEEEDVCVLCVRYSDDILIFIEHKQDARSAIAECRTCNVTGCGFVMLLLLQLIHAEATRYTNQM